MQQLTYQESLTIGQQVKLAEIVAPVALNIDQGLALAKGIREALADSAEIHFHGSVPPACSLMV